MLTFGPWGRLETCPTDGPRTMALQGHQDDQFKELDVSGGLTIDATSAAWLGIDDYPVRVDGGAQICWQGGRIEGTYPDTDSWDRMHDTAAFTSESPKVRLVGIRVHNYGDAINVKDGADDFVIRGAHLSYIRDDCVENDYLNSGTLEDSLLDGCYTALSAQPADDQEHLDGRGNEWVIRRSLIRLQPMPTVYKGDAPGHGRFFKWDNEGRGPTMSLHGNVFRVDQPPNNRDLSVPEEYLGSCSDNVIVWLGEGDFPADPLPDCFTITTDPAVWDDAVAAWHDRFGSP